MKGNLTKVIYKNTKLFHLNNNTIKAIQINDLALLKKHIEDGATIHTIYGVDLHRYNTEHENLLHIAVKLGREKITEYLLSIGMDINAKSRRHRVPLHFAALLNNNENIAKLLVAHHCDIEAKDDDNATPFMWAAYLGNLNVLKFLYEKKANPHTSDNFHTPFEWACMRGNIEVVQFMLNHIQLTKKQINTATLYAAENCKEEVLTVLNKYQ